MTAYHALDLLTVTLLLIVYLHVRVVVFFFIGMLHCITSYLRVFIFKVFLAIFSVFSASLSIFSVLWACS